MTELELFSVGFSLFATWQNLYAIVGGVLVGTIVGAIPAMTMSMGVALALPFTFYMNPVTGILLLVGIYKGAIYGGSISAILINTPGTPAAACTILDGYPLAKRGEAKRALSMALYSSCIADFISNLSLILFAGFIASFALRFGPPEFFMLIVFSLTIIAGVSGKSLTRGLVSAGFGLILATVGLDLVYGSERFVFGSPDMLGGLNLIPVLVGLFALPEIIDACARKSGYQEIIRNVGQKLVGWAEVRRCLPSIFRGSLIGVVLGAIPGIGAAPAAFLSYSEAKRTSKYAENFGKGEIEGVAAAEAGNNGVAGATLIPLLSLGVPGDVTTAIMLGAFMIHGLQPGPLLFQQNLDIVYALFCGILLSSVWLLVIGRIGIRFFAQVAEVPSSILLPVVLVLCFFGSYAINNSMFDILVMITMGVFGFFMLKFELPPAPFLIAFVLGPLFEDNLRRSLLISRGEIDIFFRGGITWFFIVLTIFSFLFIAKRNLAGFMERRASRRP